MCVWPLAAATSLVPWPNLTSKPFACSDILDEFVPTLATGHRIGKPKVLFRRIEPSKAAEWKERFKGTQEEGEWST